MLTIGRHWHTETANGDRPAACDYCAVMWPRSQLVRDMAGLLRCPNEGNGADIVELSLAQGQQTPRRRHPDPGGKYSDEGLTAAGYPNPIGPPPNSTANWIQNVWVP